MKTARLFANGRSQAVRLPKDLRFSGNEVYIRKFEDLVIIFPKGTSWKPLLNSLDKFTSDFMSERQQDRHQHREDMS